MSWKPGRGRLRLALSIFVFFFLLSFLVWIYLNSGKNIDRPFAASLELYGGILFSLAAGLFTWSLESRRDYLEIEVKRRTEETLQKNSENKKSEVVSAGIYQACHVLFSDIDHGKLLERVMDLIGKALCVDEGSIMLLNPEGFLFIAASRGVPGDVCLRTHLRIGERVAGRAAQFRREFLIVDGLENYPEFQGIESNPRIRSSIVCPLICQNELLGVLNLNRTTTRENFTVADMLHASIFAAQAAQALQNAALVKNLKKKVAELEEKNRRIKILQARLSDPL